jgi:hypothetical protein
MIGIFGTTGDFPFFLPDSLWLLWPKEKKWALRHPAPGYRLIDFFGRFVNDNWLEMKEKIAILGQNYERADEVVFTEAAFTIFKAIGVKAAENWYHWGNAVDSGGSRVSVGRFVSDGWGVYGSHQSSASSSLRVAVARKFIKR